MSVRAGLLRHRITIRVAADVRNEIGEYEPTWSDLATVWAQVKTESGVEAMRGDVEEATYTHTVRIRYLDGVTSKDRIAWGLRTFEVVAVVPDERHTELRIRCVERA